MDFATIAAGGSTSTSVTLPNESIVGVDVPQMKATTAKLLVEKTVPVQENTPDASCTWRPVYDGLGVRLSIPLPASPAACTVVLTPDTMLMPGRVRFVAVDSSDVAVVQTAEKSIVVNTRRVR